MMESTGSNAVNGDLTSAAVTSPSIASRPGTASMPIVVELFPEQQNGQQRGIVFPTSPRSATVGLSAAYAAVGDDVLTNATLAQRFDEYGADGIFQRTGIQNRRSLGARQTLATMAATAARAALAGEHLELNAINKIICSTTTPPCTSPSTACLLLAELATGDTPWPAASDISAASTGYLYALEAAFNFVQVNPAAAAMVVTAEAPSLCVDPRDFDTAVLFGDAATACVVYGDNRAPQVKAPLRLCCPALGAKSDAQGALHVPLVGNGFVHMNGARVFVEAVRQMAAMLERACAEQGMSVHDLDYIVPHQANGRILDALQRKLGVPAERVINGIEQAGNTSSSSIPLCLSELLSRPGIRGKIGLCAFGAGFTFGAAILDAQ